jgi:antitoxin component YwqK of YwqJK toxin-antitoxin module
MNMVFRIRSVCIAAGAVFLCGVLIGRLSTAQESDTKSAPTDGSAAKSATDRAKIQPYTGKPIYLDEPEPVAPPTLIRREKKAEPYKDGKPRTERQIALFSDNHFEADGYYREYYRSGKPFVEGTYTRGRQNGEWTYYFENGNVNRKATYKDGRPDGAWEVRREDGTLAAKHSFREGERHGEWITYDKTGEQPLREEHYDSGKADGVWKLWFPNGRLRQQNSFKQGKRDGVSTDWTEKGDKRVEVTYADNKLDGTTTYWMPDGRKIVQQYKAGRLISESRQ